MLRFELTVRKLINFRKRMTQKGPIYMMCNDSQSSCTRPSAKPRTGCQDCEYTIQRNIMMEELDRELKLIKGTTREQHREHKQDRMIKIVGEIGYISSQAGENTDPNWLSSISTLVSVYRNEKIRMRSIEDWNLQQKIESRNKK